jgi:hypothetical protein
MSKFSLNYLAWHVAPYAAYAVNLLISLELFQ